MPTPVSIRERIARAAKAALEAGSPSPFAEVHRSDINPIDLPHTACVLQCGEDTVEQIHPGNPGYYYRRMRLTVATAINNAENSATQTEELVNLYHAYAISQMLADPSFTVATVRLAVDTNHVESQAMPIGEQQRGAVAIDTFDVWYFTDFDDPTTFGTAITQLTE